MTHECQVGVVLTGGASRRMGVDKSTMVVGGKPMAVRVADALWEAGCHPVECQGGDRMAIAEYGLEAHPDTRPGDGPVAAILDALVRHDGSDVVVAALRRLRAADSAARSASVRGIPLGIGPTGRATCADGWPRAGRGRL